MYFVDGSWSYHLNVNSKRLISCARWFGSALGLAGIVSVYAWVVHGNATTVALTMLLFIVFLATRLGLRYAIVTSLAATGCYNFFFLPPLHTFVVADPQNFLALIVFLISSVVASRMSERIKDESREAHLRRSELEVLYSLSRGLLQTDELAVLTNSVPAAVALACGAKSALFYLLDGDRVYLYGADWPSQLGTAELQGLAHASAISVIAENQQAAIPLRTGVRPRGVLLLRGVQLSVQTLEALGGLVSVALDRARAVEEVSRAEAAQENERLRTLMLDSITHELRTPLTSIKGSVSTLLSSTLTPELSRELLTIIDEESDRLNRLVAQSVEMAQLDTLEVSMTFSPQDLREMVEAAVQSNSLVLTSHPVHIQIPQNFPEVEADEAWMPKLIGNLLENAAKYSAEGQPIFVSAEVLDEKVLCSIADRGAGIDPVEQSLIFDKFYRSRERAANTSGTGMGLSICRAIAEAHHGSITVTSQPGHGSVFTFSLPMHRMS